MSKLLLISLSAIIAYSYGEWTSALSALFLMVIVDYASGVSASAIEGTLSSKIGLTGIARKIFIFLIVAIGHKIDIVLGNGNLMRDTSIYFYMANELLSLIENFGRLGVPIPNGILNTVAVFKGKAGS